MVMKMIAVVIMAMLGTIIFIMILSVILSIPAVVPFTRIFIIIVVNMEMIKFILRIKSRNFTSTIMITNWTLIITTIRIG